MRYGLIADVHGNLHALTAVITALERLGVERWICAGDVIGYGANPNECVQMVEALRAATIAGNHELIATGGLQGNSGKNLVLASHRWTRAALHDDVLALLQKLPRVVEQDGIVVAHGSLRDPEQYVNTDEQCSAQLRQLQDEYPNARMLILGHTHTPRLYVEGIGTLQQWPHTGGISLPLQRLCLVNPGSVGQSRQWELPPRARAAVLDTEEWFLRPVRLTYAFWRTWGSARARDLTYRTMHSPPPLGYSVRRSARRYVKGLRRRR